MAIANLLARCEEVLVEEGYAITLDTAVRQPAELLQRIWESVPTW